MEIIIDQMVDLMDEEESLSDIYDRLVEEDGDYRMRFYERLGVGAGLLDEDKTKAEVLWRKIIDKYHEEFRDNIDRQEGLACKSVDYEGVKVEIYGMAHGYDSLTVNTGISAIDPIFEVPLFHDMADEVEKRIQNKVEELLDDGAKVYYEEGGGRHFSEGQFRDQDVVEMNDAGLVRENSSEVRNYVLKQIAKIPFYKLVSRVPYDFGHPTLDQIQTAENARLNAGAQKDLENLINSRPSYRFEKSFLEEAKPELTEICCKRSEKMARKVKNEAEKGETDRIAVFVGEGHVSRIADILEDYIYD
jgi:hypothetical protein